MADLARARLRVAVAGGALAAFAELVPVAADAIIVRDAAIQRFEFTVEAVWKAAQAVLDATEGLLVASPKSAIRASHDVGWLTAAQADAAFDAIDDRNMTSHTYDRDLAELLRQRLPAHLALLQTWQRSLASVLGRAP